MTMLGKFISSAKGAALAGALASALFPAGQASAAHYDVALLTGLQTSETSVSRAEREQRAEAFLGDVARMESQAAVLEKLRDRVAWKHAELSRAMQCFDGLGAELQATVQDGVPPRRQVELLAAAAAGWLDRMKGELANACSPEPVAMEEGPEADGQWSAGDFPQKMEALESRVKSAVDLIDGYAEENARIEKVLGELVADLDVMMKSAADPASGAAEGYAGFEKFTFLLADFNAAHARPALKVLGMEDDLKGDIRGPLLPGMPGGVE